MGDIFKVCCLIPERYSSGLTNGFINSCYIKSVSLTIEK